ncbi:MAG: hypothetical protein JW747_02165 [Candidatus Aminicenantes bacterium]|nr:hypothetical protein [Candidatus Aminicenantes bacterium]
MRKTTAGVAWALAAGWLFGCSFSVAAQERSAYREAVEQADRLFQGGNFRNAAERYFFASQATKERLELARAYIGLSMSYLYLKDESAAEKWVRKVLEAAPRLKVDVPDYPISFVQFFGRVRADVFKESSLPAAAEEEIAKTAPSAPDVAAAEKSEPSPVKTSPPPDSPRPSEPKGKETRPDTTPEPAQVKPLPPAAARPQVPAVPKVFRPGGRFQVMFHASNWTIDPVLNIVERLVRDKIGEEILNQVDNELRTKYFTLVASGSEQALDFDSSGSNFGLEIRYFSRGWGGTFSLGLAFDRTTIRLALAGRVMQSYTNGTSVEAEANGALTTDLSSTVLSFRWDISPASRLTPFIILGLGVTPFQGRVSYEYSGTYDAVIFQDTISGGEEKTFSELAEEQEFDMIDVFVVLQLAVGFDIEVFKGLTGVVEAGLWDGFYLRGGLGYRF